MEIQKKYFRRWWLWFTLLIILTGVILIGLNYVGIIGQTIVEHKVFENSYQKYEADKTASTIYAAQLSQLRVKLNNSTLSESAKIEIKAQIDAITILKLIKED